MHYRRKETKKEDQIDYSKLDEIDKAKYSHSVIV